MAKCGCMIASAVGLLTCRPWRRSIAVALTPLQQSERYERIGLTKDWTHRGVRRDIGLVLSRKTQQGPDRLHPPRHDDVPFPRRPRHDHRGDSPAADRHRPRRHQPDIVGSGGLPRNVDFPGAGRGPDVGHLRAKAAVHYRDMRVPAGVGLGRRIPEHVAAHHLPGSAGGRGGRPDVQHLHRHRRYLPSRRARKVAGVDRCGLRRSQHRRPPSRRATSPTPSAGAGFST